MNLPLSAIVLAGGQSSRMGHDKALIPIQGVPLLKRTCSVALQCTPAVYVVTFRPEAYRALIDSNCQLILEKPLHQSTPHGPLIGFAQGLAQVQSDWVLLLACDLPYLRHNVLQRWMLQLANTDAEFVLPRAEKGWEPLWEPLCGFYRSSCLPKLQSAIARGERSFQRWLASETVQAIAFSDDPEIGHQERQMLFNCNTLGDLAKVRDEVESEG